MGTYLLRPDVGHQLPVPGIDVLPVNAFVLQAARTCRRRHWTDLGRRGSLAAPGSLVDIEDVRRIWLTHPTVTTPAVS